MFLHIYLKAKAEPGMSEAAGKAFQEEGQPLGSSSKVATCILEEIPEIIMVRMILPD